MRVDLRTRGTGRSRLRLTCQATALTPMILVTFVSSSRPIANMPDPGYRVLPSELSFFSRLTDGENQHLASTKSR
jgi:hypothetical protein